MVDVIILLIVIVLIIFAVKGSIKHFRGESPCCGGNVRKEEKKLSGVVLGEKDVIIEGMTCDGCSARVQNALNKLDGLSATLDLASNTAHIRFTHLVKDEDIIKAVENAGYKVKAIR